LDLSGSESAFGIFQKKRPKGNGKIIDRKKAAAKVPDIGKI